MVTTSIVSTPTAPAVKLPLITRKNIRDEYDAKLPDLEKQIKDILGEEYKADIDFPTLFTLCTEGRERECMGDIAFETLESFVNNLKDLTQNGENKNAVNGFNDTITTRKFTIHIDDECPSWSGCKVVDGLFVMMFKPGDFGTNNGDASANMKGAIDAAIAKNKPTQLPLTAKMGIKKDWEDEQADVEKRIAQELNGDLMVIQKNTRNFANSGIDNTVTCHADYAAIWKTIVDVHSSLGRNNKDDVKLEDCSRNFGYFIKEYFVALSSYMDWQFKKDDMFVEAFLDAVETKQVWFEMVGEEGVVKSYCDCAIIDGKLIARTTPQNFGVNVNNAFENLMNLL